MLRALASSCSFARAECASVAHRSFAAAAQEQSGPVYVIFGAAGGIGSALAARLLKQADANVVLCGRSQERLDGLVQSLGGGHAFVSDPLQPKGAEEAIEHALEKFGKVDGVANCIGSLVLKGLHVTTEKEFRDSFEVNTMSAFHVGKAALKPMLSSGGGSIVLFSSAVAKHGVPNHEAIASAKAGVYGLALSAAATYAPKNIRFNVVAPGLTDTPLASRMTSSEPALKASAAMHPLKRIGAADEPAAAAEFLLLPSNSFITGQFLAVDGGLSSIKAK